VFSCSMLISKIVTLINIVLNKRIEKKFMIGKPIKKVENV